ncbi:hypothetical protein ACLOJK_026434 [Asimina triloba]
MVNPNGTDPSSDDSSGVPHIVFGDVHPTINFDLATTPLCQQRPMSSMRRTADPSKCGLVATENLDPGSIFSSINGHDPTRGDRPIFISTNPSRRQLQTPRHQHRPATHRLWPTKIQDRQPLISRRSTPSDHGQQGLHKNQFDRQQPPIQMSRLHGLHGTPNPQQPPPTNTIHVSSNPMTSIVHFHSYKVGCEQEGKTHNTRVGKKMGQAGHLLPIGPNGSMQAIT